MNLTLSEIAEAIGGTVLPRYENVSVSGISRDSRSVKSGELFVPIPGAAHDGHPYIPEAASKGASVVTAKDVPEGIPFIKVSDTVKAYGAIAHYYLSTLNVRRIAVTGSVGKTTTKEMIASVMESEMKTAKTAGNKNNQIGLPDSVLAIPGDAQAAVVEMGMNHFGEISYLSKIFNPEIAVITNIGSSHIEYLGSREGIRKAKLEITDGMPDDGILVLNGDEPLLWELRETLRCRKVYFGIENRAADVVGDDLLPTDDGTSLRISGLKNDFQVYVPSAGKHNVYNALAACTVGIIAGVKPSSIQKALSSYQNTGMRQKIFEEKGFTIIEDCYNAGPESMEAALNVLKEYHCKGRRIAVLGDMLELGNISLAEHYRVGRLVARSADLLFGYGELSERTVSGAITGGMASNSVYHFTSQEHMARMLRSRARAGDVLLFKGSRGMKMEDVLEMFLHSDDLS